MFCIFREARQTKNLQMWSPCFPNFLPWCKINISHKEMLIIHLVVNSPKWGGAHKCWSSTPGERSASDNIPIILGIPKLLLLTDLLWYHKLRCYLSKLPEPFFALQFFLAHACIGMVQGLSDFLCHHLSLQKSVLLLSPTIDITEMVNIATELGCTSFPVPMLIPPNQEFPVLQRSIGLLTQPQSTRQWPPFTS